MRDDAFDRLRDRPRQNRLRGSRDVLEQDVATADERRQHELDPIALAVDDGLDVVEEALRELDRTHEHVIVCSSERLGFHRRPLLISRASTAHGIPD